MYYEKNTSIQCPCCRSYHTIKWGQKRRQCSHCSKTFTPYRNKKIRPHRHRTLFRLWITSASTVELLSQLFSLSPRTLWWHIDRFLAVPPQPQPPRYRHTIWLKVDATHLGRWGCITVYRTGNKIIYWQFAPRECYDVYVAGLRWLTQAGYVIAGVTSDWHGSIVAAVQFMLPTVPHQRCLVHTQRLCQSFITTRPKTEAGYMLLRIARELNYLHNHYDVRIWKQWLTLWERRYGELIKEHTQGKKEDGARTWWYTHRNLRRAFRTLNSSQAHLFLYLDYIGLDKDTNGLEANFTHLKEKLRIHRGLKRKKQVAFIFWYLYFKSR